MANDSISTWTDETQEKENQKYTESGIPKNSINTPLQPTRQEILEKLELLVDENKRLITNSNDIKLQLIEAREKLLKITNIINK